MHILHSLTGMASVAMWSALMNWRSMISLFPALEYHVNELEDNSEEALRNLLGTWSGVIFVVLIISLSAAYFVPSVWGPVRTFVLAKWSTTCSIPEDTMAYDRIRTWVDKQQEFQSVSNVTVLDESEGKIGEDGVDFPEGIDCLTTISRMRSNEIGMASFSPAFSKVRFWRNGAYFWFTERGDKKLNEWGREIPDRYLEIYCFSWNRSLKPVKDLLLKIKRQQDTRSSGKTEVYLPHLLVEEHWYWKLSRRCVKRPLHTVIMDRQQIYGVVSEVRSFLSRAGVEWYRDKGLPLRIGYLFSGPPGTGKSSFAFALAGHFGLPIYMMNLSAQGLTDLVIEKLFSKLPFHCIVLLEDIDATKPLTREDTAEVSHVTKGARDEKKEGKVIKKNEVTLSGLLNVIDGVGATEGRILIMTTNHIEVLDEALIRTGRADRILNFTQATREQAKDMFVNAYKGVRWVKQPGDVELEDWVDEDIAHLSKQFADKIRDQEFSPALLQQYFKDFRAQPRRAVEEIDAWMKDPRGYRKPSLKLESSFYDVAFGTGRESESHLDTRFSLIAPSTQLRPDSGNSSPGQGKRMSVPGDFRDCFDEQDADFLESLIDLS
ncbi:hypothetical protein VPNG_03420 [Cytospora leucostoma]|uniref:AAA+ ATPase domain-containing protein n=1 Tax=Cytospora leucostoma TaxID=1230097 RepID=A0A423XFN2_9PEZI|nr:hypothetical protein VPNG_03420 [Cytospora leucostoma]